MTGNVYVIQLADGRSVKMRVDRYYYEDKQLECENGNLSIATPTGSGNYKISWGFLF